MGPAWRNFAPEAALTPSHRWEIGLFQGRAEGKGRLGRESDPRCPESPQPPIDIPPFTRMTWPVI